MVPGLYHTLCSLFRLMTPGQKKQGLACVSVMLVSALLEIAAAALIVTLAARLMAPGDRHGLVELTVACVAVFGIKGAMALLDSRTQSRWIQNLVLDFKQRLIGRYTRMDYAQQVTRNSSQSLSVLFSDTDIYMSQGLLALGIILSELCVSLILISFLIYLQPGVTVLLGGMFVILGLVFIKFLAPAFRRWGQTLNQTIEQGYAQAMQILQSYKDILIFGKAKYFVSIYQDLAQKRADVTVKASVAQVLPRTLIETMFVVFFAGMVMAFAWLDYDTATITQILSAYLYAGFRLLPGLNRMMVQLNMARMAEPAMERVVADLLSPVHESAYVSQPGLTFNRDIVASHVTYRYATGDRGDILKDVSLTIAKGEFVGIIGETGSGKSTLLHLLLGLLTPASGSVMIDDAWPANAVEWHENVGYAAQNFHLIDGSIADNIAFGIPASERDPARIATVIRDARLDGFMARLPHGLDSQIGEKGVLISGGERQRIALARALYRNPPVLMLDEATSALDLETEAAIMDTIESLRASGLTIIAVTHRLDTLKAADRILVMDKGVIIREEKRAQKAALSN